MSYNAKQLDLIVQELRPEFSERDLKERYDDMLDECYGDIKICGYEYYASNAFKCVDPIAYACGFSDYESSILDDYLEIDGDYYRRDDIDKLMEDDDNDVQD
jgi:hypothetical protein